MKTTLVLSVCIAAVLAAPTDWTPELAAVYTEASNIIRSGLPAQPPSCDLSNVDIVKYLATIPNAPAVVAPGNARLVEVTIGRGVQNYSCADNQATTIPKQIGAVANLYNVSCIAANYPRLLTLIPPFAAQVNVPLDANTPMTGFGIKRSGHHFFDSTGTPRFDLNDNSKNQLGLLIANGKAPEMKVAAPTPSAKVALRPNDSLPVPWLKLNAMNGTTGGLTAVYRVVTAGGTAPANCSGQPSLVSVQYAAQYWFYVSPE